MNITTASLIFALLNGLRMRKLFLPALLLQLCFVCTTIDAQTEYFTQDTIVLKLNNCNGNFDICFAGISTGTNPNLSVSINGIRQNRPYSGCGTDTVSIYSTVNIDPSFGPYRLDSLTIGSANYRNVIFANSKDLADSLNKWDPTAKWIYDAQFRNILGKPKQNYSALFYAPLNASLSNKLGLNRAYVPKGLKLRLSRGSHKVVASDSFTGQKDSVQIIVGCTVHNYVVKTVKAGEKVLHCNNITLLPGKKILSNQPLSPLKKTYAEFSKVPGDSCISIMGIKPGKDTFTYVLRGRSGINDTTTIYVNVLSNVGVGGKHYVNQTVKVGQTVKYCINTNALLPKPGDTIASVTNYCGGSQGKIAGIGIGNLEKCVQIAGLSPGTDSACVVITSNEGVSDTTIIRILVVVDCKNLIPDALYKVQISECSELGRICIDGFGITDTARYAFLIDSVLYHDFIKPCNEEKITGISYQNLYDDKTGNILPFPFTVEGWGVNSNSYPPQGERGILVNSLQEIVDVLNKWNPAGKWQLDTLHRYFVGGESTESYDKLFLINNVVFSAHYAEYNSASVFKGISFPFGKGVHRFSVTDKLYGCKDETLVAVSCATAKTIYRDIAVNSADSVCIETGSLPGKTIAINNPLKNGRNVAFSPTPDSKCARYYGKRPGRDTLVVIACDEYNFCDTTTLIVNVLPAVNNHVRFDTIFTAESRKICFDSLLFGTVIRSFVNVSGQSGSSVIFIADAKTRCLNYNSTGTPGTDTARIIICNANDYCDTTTIYVTVKARKLPLYVFKDTVVLYNTGSLCLPRDKFGIALSTPIEVKNICDKGAAGKVAYSLQPNLNCLGPGFFVYSVTYKGKAMGTDTACIEVTNAAGKKDTIKVVVTVIPRESHVLSDSVYTGTAAMVKCLDFKQSNLSGPVDTAFNICASSSGLHAAIKLQRSSTCKSGWGINYDGINPGTDAACVVLRDKKGNSDTIAFTVVVLQKTVTSVTLKDTIWAFQNKFICLDTAGLNVKAAIDSIWNDCPGSSGKHVVFSIDKNKGCLTGNGNPGIAISLAGADAGTDSSCYVLRDVRGFIYRANVIVTVRRPWSDVLTDKVEEGKKIVLCLDSTQLAGKVISAKNICPDKSGTHARFTINNVTKCVEIEGLKVGKDSACIVLCNASNVCDTTYIHILVLPSSNPVVLEAVDDTDSTQYPNPVTIFVLKNDKFNKSDSVKIVIGLVGGRGPGHGLAIVDSVRRQITYLPDPNVKYCGTDTFAYYIAIGQKRDTALVYVFIECEKDSIRPFRVYNAFSPNGDGQNDTFAIDGLESFPGNELFVYNRWGNQVYTRKNYDNSWDGTWEGNPLPDGTYYYLLSLPSGNTVKQESGYLELRR